MSNNSSISSGILTANTLLFNGTTYLKSVVIQGGATVTIYDGIDATGKIIFQYDSQGTPNREFFDFSHMVQSKNGMYVVVTGGSTIVYYG